MVRAGREIQTSADEGPSGPLLTRVIATGQGWSVNEFICRAGPSDRPFEERHEGYSIAAVAEGSFTYKADSGDAMMHPGSLLLGNSGNCFQCGHDHSKGDRCVALNFAPDCFAEIAAAAAGTSRFQFSAPMAPADKTLAPIIVGMEAIARAATPLRLEETMFRLAETVIETLSGQKALPARVSPREARRIADVLRHIEDHAAEPLDLDALASVARLSKYHFLRIFRRVVGVTPHQFLLNLRLRRAAMHLLKSSETVTSVAFDEGFSDLSTFNNHFRDVFGVSPVAYRARGVG